MTDFKGTADEAFMQIALLEARKGQGFVEPNPMVGCAIVRDGELVGTGHHEQFGGPHAEVMALRSLASPGDAVGATAYVTLEPCCHVGKTPPCAEALIQARVARVVVGVQDPFPKVDGGGLKRLTDAGIQCVVGVLANEASDVIAPFAKHVQSGMPWSIAKWAMTLDGKIATTSGQSQWITGPQSRAEVHRLRGRVDAVMTAMGTVIADNPMLTARPPGPRCQTRVVLCRSRLPAISSKLVQSVGESPVLLMTSDLISQEQTAPMADVGVEVVSLKTNNRAQMVSDAMRVLGSRSMTNVMVEGGGELLGSCLAAKQIDECHVFVGAKIFGGSMAPGPVGGEGIARLTEAESMTLKSVDSFGGDVRLVYRKTLDA